MTSGSDDRRGTVDEQRSDDNLPERDINDDIEPEARARADSLERVAANLSRVADALSRGSEQLAAPPPPPDPEPVAADQKPDDVVLVLDPVPTAKPALLTEPITLLEEAVQPAKIPPAPPAPEPPKPERAPEPEPEIDDFVFAANRLPEVAGPDPEPVAAAPIYKPKHLSRGAFAAVRSFAEALLPEGGDLAVGATRAGVAGRIDAWLGRVDEAVRKDVMALIGAVDRAPLPTRGRRLSKLPPQAAAHWIERALDGRSAAVRDKVSRLKALCTNELASTLAAEEALGFTYGCATGDPVRPAPPLEVIAHPTIEGNHTEECDAVVVGSGAGGAAVAKELAEAGLSVIVLEEGLHHKRIDFAGPPSERMRRMYRATAAHGPTTIPVPTGTGVGGTTLINAGTCMRAPDQILESWHLDGIDAQTMKPIFERVEKVLHVQAVPQDLLGRNGALFKDGAARLDFSAASAVRAIAGCRGCGVCTFGCPSDAKQSTNISYLPRAQHAGATIYAGCRADRILVRNGRAAGIVATITDERGRAAGTLRVGAKIVVIAAGALATPALLAASALANRSGMLGRNLTINPSVTVGAIFEEAVHSWRGTQQPVVCDEWLGVDGCLIQVAATIPSADAGGLPGAGIKFKNLLGRMPFMGSARVGVPDAARGRVGRTGIDYQTTKEDAAALTLGMARAAEIFLAAGAKAVFTGLREQAWVTDAADLASLRDARPAAPTLRPSGLHPAGTARMGADPSASVVDPWGEAHDVEGLFVADASVFPSCISVPPQMTIMALATRTAGHIANVRAPVLV